MRAWRMMRWLLALVVLSGLAAAVGGHADGPRRAYRRLPVTEYRDKMKAGWVGQMAGVSFGAPTEFRWRGQIIPEDQVPRWREGMVNDAFGQDDLYVEMTFLRTLEERGLDLSPAQAGADWANSQYGLAHANRVGRRSLRRGIAPPDSGHPWFNRHADDIDFQIESDFTGLVAPGLPNTVIALGDKFGHLMNYGDGVYAGQFVGAMYAEAFFESDPVKLARVALKAIPADSLYAEMVRDVLRWHGESPDDWERTWQRVERKYHGDPAYVKGLCSEPGGAGDFCIDAKLNGAYILIGLLYGGRNPERTMAIACRCGQDSDCNPSNAAGVLFTTMGFSHLDPRYAAGLDQGRVFSNTAYDFPTLLAACERVARQSVLRAGGRIEVVNGEEVFLIPVQRPKPIGLEQSWNPGPTKGRHRHSPNAESSGLTSSTSQGRSTIILHSRFPQGAPRA